MIAPRQHVATRPVADSVAERRSFLQALREAAKLYTHEELSASHAMVLDCLEEYEERIYRIEYFLIDLCLALRGFICDMEFSQLKKEFQKDLENQAETNIDTKTRHKEAESPGQGGSACPSAEEIVTSYKNACGARRPVRFPVACPPSTSRTPLSVGGGCP